VVFRKLERQLEKAVESTFGRAFKASVQPVELAHKLAKEMGDNKWVSVSRVYVPNVYEVYLSPDDYQQFAAFQDALSREMSAYLTAHAQREGWTLVGPPAIELYSDADLRLGEFGIATRTEAPSAPVRPVPQQMPPGTPPDQMAPQAAPPDQMAPQAAPPGAPPLPPQQPVTPAQVSPQVPPPPVPPPITPPAPPQGFAPTVVLPATPPPVVPGPAPGATYCGALRVGADVFTIADGGAIIGRSRRADIVLSDPNVSRQHAEVRREGDSYVVLDLDSTNGVFVNGRPAKRATLQEGDVIELGATRLRFERHQC